MYKLLFISFFCTLTTAAQVQLPVPRNVQALYQKGTRTTNGKPGKNYWQNTAAYNIAISYNPVTRLITGTEQIEYTSNSPAALKELVFKIYPNIFSKGVSRNMPVEPADLTDAVEIDSVQVENVTKGPKQLRANGTNLTVKEVNIASGATVKISLRFSYTLNKNSHIRTGEIEPGAAFIAYFFPRIAVYDDLDGWNRNPYLGAQEFYNDFCNFNVSIAVPQNFLVWATGDLQNCSEVLAPKYCQRLQQAEQNDEQVFIVDENDLKAGGITASNAVNTWRFSASNVVDFAFAVSDHYVWNSTSLVVDSASRRRTRVDAVFNTQHKDYFEVAGIARKTVELMSHHFPKWPFPYSHISIFDGLDQMEYPMMVNDNPVETKADAVTLTDHEIFHTMFPFYMGVNETKYAWMDEGWATMGEWVLSPLIDSSVKDDFGVDATSFIAGNEEDMPITTLTTQLSGTPFFLNSYPKPAFGYWYVKDMLGDALFTKALHYYISQWNGKHPLPLDFFNCINNGSGKNLNWFWKKWFYEDGYADLAIAAVTEKGAAKNINIQSLGNKPMPVDVLVTFTDGTTQNFHRSIAVWEKANSTMITFNSSKKIKTVLVGGFYSTDSITDNNTWPNK
ncbi:MAG: hypothetical protein RL172_3134 [Bacteroidota bacterium]